MLLEEFEQLYVLLRVSYHRVQKNFKDPMVVSAALLDKRLALPDAFLFKLNECISAADPQLGMGPSEVGRTFEASFRFIPHEAASQGRNHRMNDRAMPFFIRDNELQEKPGHGIWHSAQQLPILLQCFFLIRLVRFKFSEQTVGRRILSRSRFGCGKRRRTRNVSR